MARALALIIRSLTLTRTPWGSSLLNSRRNSVAGVMSISVIT